MEISNFYNINYNIKYNEIENELYQKYKNTKYDFDISPICEKLYVDELANVFYANNFYDDKIDQGIQHLFHLFLENNKIFLTLNKIFLVLNNEIYDNEICNNKICDNEIRDNKICDKIDLEMTKYILFSKKCFYLTHKLIKELSENSESEKMNEILNEIINVSTN